ncbi:MAG TPA: ABC transporter substrate-binding protein [Chloroflexota bacterium]
MLSALVTGCALPTVPAPHSTAAPIATAIATPTAVPPTPTATPRPVLADVDVTLPGVLDTLNPLLSRSAAARAVASLVFPGLVTSTADGQFVASLAANWRASGLTWTFHLDPTRHWQDGASVTSADVAYTLNLIQAANSPVEPQAQSAWQGIQVATPDLNTVVLTVPPSVGSGILDLATVPILPAHLLGATPAGALQLLPFDSHPIGSGAYRVVAANSLTATLVTTGRDDLQPRQVTVRMVGSGSNAPVATQPRVGAITLLGSDNTSSGIPTTSLPLARPVFVFFNVHDPTLGDVAVRRALNLAVSRTKLVADPLLGFAQPLRGPMLTGIWEAGGTAELPTHDLAAAAQDLQNSGWLSAPNGTRSRASTPLAITLLVDVDPGRLAVAQAIAADWQAVGVLTSVQTVGLDGLLRDFVAPGHFQAAIIGTQQRGVVPDLADLWHTGGGLNISGWNDPVADAGLESTLSADPATQRAGYRAFAQRFADEVPAIPLYVPTVRYVVQGLRLPPAILNDPAEVLRGATSWRATP